MIKQYIISGMSIVMNTKAAACQRSCLHYEMGSDRLFETFFSDSVRNVDVSTDLFNSIVTSTRARIQQVR